MSGTYVRTPEIRAKQRKPHPSTRGENNPAKRPEVRAKLSVKEKGKSNPNTSESLRAFYRTKRGLKKKFLFQGNCFGRVSWGRRSWRRFLWWLGFSRRREG